MVSLLGHEKRTHGGGYPDIKEPLIENMSGVPFEQIATEQRVPQ